MDDELAAARDYWAQIYERLSKHESASRTGHNRTSQDVPAGRIQGLFAAFQVPEEKGVPLLDQYLEALANAPVTSPGMDPHTEYILHRICTKIEKACDKIPALKTRNVAKGIEPRPGVFASRMGVIMTDASVIAVGANVFSFCNLVSKALVKTIFIDPLIWDNLLDKDVQRLKLCAQHDVLDYWFNIFASFALLGGNLTTPFEVPHPDNVPLRDEILDTMEVFLIAHEYAHHLCKHGRLETASNESGVDNAARNEEHEADAIAVAIGQMVTGHSERENFLMLAGVGMVVVLHALQMLAEAKQILKPATIEPSSGPSHPSAVERIRFVDQQAWLWPKADAQFRHFRSIYANIMEIVWKELRPAFQELARERK